VPGCLRSLEAHAALVHAEDSVFAVAHHWGEKLPSTALALPFLMLAGTSFKSEKVRGARMSFGAR